MSWAEHLASLKAANAALQLMTDRANGVKPAIDAAAAAIRTATADALTGMDAMGGFVKMSNVLSLLKGYAQKRQDIMTGKTSTAHDAVDLGDLDREIEKLAGVIRDWGSQAGKDFYQQWLNSGQDPNFLLNYGLSAAAAGAGGATSPSIPAASGGVGWSAAGGVGGGPGWLPLPNAGGGAANLALEPGGGLRTSGGELVPAATAVMPPTHEGGALPTPKPPTTGDPVIDAIRRQIIYAQATMLTQNTMESRTAWKAYITQLETYLAQLEQGSRASGGGAPSGSDSGPGLAVPLLDAVTRLERVVTLASGAKIGGKSPTPPTGQNAQPQGGTAISSTLAAARARGATR